MAVKPTSRQHPRAKDAKALKDSFQYPLEGYSDPLRAEARVESYASTLTLHPQGAGRDCKAAKASTLTLYTRAGCPLCDEMAEAVRELIVGTDHQLASVDVDTQPALKALYGWEVPLLFDGDAEICRHQLNLPAFRVWLRAHP